MNALTCPKCGYLSSTLASHCETCRAPLTMQAAARARAGRCRVQDERGRFVATPPSRRLKGAA